MDLRKLIEKHVVAWGDEMHRPGCDHESLADRIQTVLADEGYVVSQEDILGLVQRLAKTGAKGRSELTEGIVYIVEN
ncbi:MAG: hypothetical protein U1E76_04390 [Planctomycetota bacterium]